MRPKSVYERVHHAVYDLCAQIHREKMTHRAAVEERRTIFDSPDWKKITRRDQNYFTGVMHGALEAVWPYTYFAYDVGADKPLTFEESNEQQRELIRDEGPERGHHYWRDTVPPKRFT